VAWIISIIAVLGFGYLMFANERFRRFGFGVLVLLGIGAVALWWMGENSDRQFREERQRALSAIRADQLVISDLALSNESYGSRVTGTVLNRSSVPLRSLTMKVGIRDCPSSTSEVGCVTTGEAEARFYVEVPPGQARQLSTTVNFDHAAANGPHWGWVYNLTEIEADVD
jgi:hypothetical protein